MKLVMKVRAIMAWNVFSHKPRMVTFQNSRRQKKWKSNGQHTWGITLVICFFRLFLLWISKVLWISLIGIEFCFVLYWTSFICEYWKKIFSFFLHRTELLQILLYYTLVDHHWLYYTGWSSLCVRVVEKLWYSSQWRSNGAGAIAPGAEVGTPDSVLKNLFEGSLLPRWICYLVDMLLIYCWELTWTMNLKTLRNKNRSSPILRSSVVWSICAHVTSLPKRNRSRLFCLSGFFRSWGHH